VYHPDEEVRSMRRVNVHLEEEMNAAAEREARRRGVSKAELIRRGLARELAATSRVDDAWARFAGEDDDDPVDDLDAAIYEDDR
jgi:hypothetical protein